MAMRLLWQIALSLLLTVIVAYVALAVAYRLARDIPVLRGVLEFFYYGLGQRNTIILLGSLSVVFLVIVLNIRRAIYVAKVSESVAAMSRGHFDHRIEPIQSNEIGDIAGNVNELVDKLKISLDEERKAEQTKNELVTNVSHDLRTPLTSILGYLGLIEQDRYRDEVELRHYTRIAYDKAKQLHVLINDLFEYTRMRHDAVPLRKIELSLGEMLSQLLSHYRILLEQSGLEGNLHLPSDGETIRIHADPDKLASVFDNLLTNAMTYGAGGGKIDIYLRQDAGIAVVEVVNYGESIPSVDLPNIFDRFYRVDKSRTEHTGGSGLGLAIAKSIVERHQGSIAAYSDMERTSFVVRLPLIGRNLNI